MILQHLVSLRASAISVAACLLGYSGAQLAAATGKQGTSSPSAAGPAWKNVAAAKGTSRITIHYHRPDESYDAANLWTWDQHEKNTPKENQVTPAGRDEFGLIFEIDRSNYGGSDKIGFIPRIGSDWTQKDGGDRFWTPALGSEIWIVAKKEPIYTTPPDISPRIEAAYLDAPDRVVVRLTKPAPSEPRASITSDDGARVPCTTSPSFESPFELLLDSDEPVEFGSHRYTVEVENFAGTAAIVPRAILDDRELFFDGDVALGATYSNAATTFRIFAPTTKGVGVVLYDQATGNKGRVVHPLKQGEKGIWEGTIEAPLAGKFYSFLLEPVDGTAAREALDPYAVNSVANSTRSLIAEEIAAPGPGPHVASPTDMVIYEMHVRDFTIAPNSGVKNRGLYAGFAEGETRLAGDAQIRTGLDHLSELGVTHVQILPVHDFENDEASRKYNWGYITSAFFSPEGMFATNPLDGSRVRELKALINALHARKIGVILDVVYNHTAENASLRSVAPEYYYRHLPDGTFANGSGCGNEVRSEAPMARRLIIDSLKHWVKDYGVDGFRFDLMGLIDQETMREAQRELRSINPGIVLYGEPWTAGSTPLTEKSDKAGLRDVHPTGAFNDDYRNALKGSPDGTDRGFIQDGSNAAALKTAMLVNDWFASPEQSISYMTCHDNLVLWDKLKLSMPGADERLLKETMKLGYLALFTSQGVPFIHGGEEFGRSKGGNHNSYDAPDAVNQVDWSLKRKNLDLFNYTRDLIALRKAHPVFRLRSRDEVASRLKFETTPDKVLMFLLDGAGVQGEPWRQVCVILNSDDRASTEVQLPAGQWTVAFDDRGAGRERTVSGSQSIRAKSGMILYQR